MMIRRGAAGSSVLCPRSRTSPVRHPHTTQSRSPGSPSLRKTDGNRPRSPGPVTRFFPLAGPIESIICELNSVNPTVPPCYLEGRDKHMAAAASTQPRTAESFRAALIAEYQPQGAVEFAFLDTVVEHWDALTRARELRTRLFTNDLEALLFGPDAKKFDRLERHIAACERAFARAVRDLQGAQSSRRRATVSDTRKQESEARAAAKRASAELDFAMRASLFGSSPAHASTAPASSTHHPSVGATGKNRTYASDNVI